MGKRINIYIPNDELVKDFEEMAEADKRSLSSIVREAMRYFRDRKKEDIIERGGQIFNE